MIGGELQDIRVALGKTREEFAKLTGKGVSTLGRYESGVIPIPLEYSLAVQAVAMGGPWGQGELIDAIQDRQQ